MKQVLKQFFLYQRHFVQYAGYHIVGSIQGEIAHYRTDGNDFVVCHDSKSCWYHRHRKLMTTHSGDKLLPPQTRADLKKLTPARVVVGGDEWIQVLFALALQSLPCYEYLQ